MAGNCDICGEKLGFRKFHCQDGVVCKKCYAVVSNGFTETITKKTLAELKKTYEANAVPIDLGEDGFVVTRKIQSLLLIDEQNKNFVFLEIRQFQKNTADRRSIIMKI